MIEIKLRYLLLWKPLITKTNINMTSKSLNKILNRDYKRT